MKNNPAGAELFHANGLTDIDDEANSFCNTPNNLKKKKKKAYY